MKMVPTIWEPLYQGTWHLSLETRPAVNGEQVPASDLSCFLNEWFWNSARPTQSRCLWLNAQMWTYFFLIVLLTFCFLKKLVSESTKNLFGNSTSCYSPFPLASYVLPDVACKVQLSGIILKCFEFPQRTFWIVGCVCALELGRFGFDSYSVC